VLRHLPNAITILRMLLVAPLAWLIHDGRFGAALGVAAIAGISDALDGFLAKRFGWQSWIGGVLDPIADKLLLVTSFLVLAFAERLPAWLAALVIGRDVVIVVGAVAYHRLIGRFEAEPSALSKLTTFVQIACVIALLVDLAGLATVPDVARNALFVATGALTAVSGVHYVVVWSARARRAAHSLSKGLTR
jgi:cardiolipin synthase